MPCDIVPNTSLPLSPGYLAPDFADSGESAEDYVARLEALVAHYRTTIDLSPWVFWSANAKGEVIEASQRWFDLCGLPPERALGYGWTQIVHPDDLAVAFEKWDVCLRTGEPLDVEYRWRLKTGEIRWYRARACAVHDADGRIVKWYGTTTDIHARKTAAMALQESEARLRIALQSGSLGIWEIEFYTGQIHISDQFAINFGFQQADQLTSYKQVIRCINQPERHAFFQRIKQLINSRHELEMDLRVMWPDESIHWVRITGQVIGDADGQNLRAIGTSLDITHRHNAEDMRKNAEALMTHMATHDALTGLPNTRLLNATLASWLAERGTQRRVAIICVDIHDFKSTNDALGQNAGDLVLNQLSQRLNSLTGQDCLVGRLNGSEFALLVRGAGEPAEFGNLADMILQLVAQPTYIGDRKITLSANIGMAFAPEHGELAEQLRKNASTALARCKSRSPGKYQIFAPEMDRKRQARAALKLELQEAVNRGELQLYYQPIIDLTSGDIVSFESLMRWQHAAYGLVSPADFIPLAEETGWIVGFGRWALHEACQQATGWPQHVSVAVNLSIVQFDSGTLAEDVAEALARSGLAAHRLELEVTESLLLRQTDANTGLLNHLRAMGVRLAMDDFGTGYASLSSLRGFRFDKIKLDKSLIDGVPDQGEGNAIVEGVSGLARGLRLPVTVEGIETEPQLAYLRTQGFQYGQGYLFSRPVPAPEVTTLLARKLIP